MTRALGLLGWGHLTLRFFFLDTSILICLVFYLFSYLQCCRPPILLFLVFTALKHWQLITVSPLMIVWPGYAYLISRHNSVPAAPLPTAKVIVSQTFSGKSKDLFHTPATRSSRSPDPFPWITDKRVRLAGRVNAPGLQWILAEVWDLPPAPLLGSRSWPGLL